MATEIHKHAARLIWQSWSTIEIVDDLMSKFSLLGDATERELYVKVGQLRNLVAEARKSAPATAEQMFRDGFDLKEIEEALKAPFLLSGFEIDGIVRRAQAAVKSEQEAGGVA